MRIDRELGLAVVLLAAGLFFLVHLARAPASDAGFVTTTTVPTAVAAVLTLLAALLLLGAVLRPAATSAPAARRPAPAAPWRLVAMVAGTGLYVALMPWLGYLVGSALYIAGLAWLYGTRSWLAILVLAVVVPVLLMTFFERYMIVLLPSARLLD